MEWVISNYFTIGCVYAIVMYVIILIVSFRTFGYIEQDDGREGCWLSILCIVLWPFSIAIVLLKLIADGIPWIINRLTDP